MQYVSFIIIHRWVSSFVFYVLESVGMGNTYLFCPQSCMQQKYFNTGHQTLLLQSMIWMRAKGITVGRGVSTGEPHDSCRHP